MLLPVPASRPRRHRQIRKSKRESRPQLIAHAGTRGFTQHQLVPERSTEALYVLRCYAGVIRPAWDQSPRPLAAIGSEIGALGAEVSRHQVSCPQEFRLIKRFMSEQQSLHPRLPLFRMYGCF